MILFLYISHYQRHIQKYIPKCYIESILAIMKSKRLLTINDFFKNDKPFFYRLDDKNAKILASTHYILTNEWLMFPFYTPCRHKKPSGFLIFQEGV